MWSRAVAERQGTRAPEGEGKCEDTARDHICIYPAMNYHAMNYHAMNYHGNDECAERADRIARTAVNRNSPER